MILAFDSNFTATPPEIREVYSIWPVTVIILLALLIIGAYYLGRRARRSGPAEGWSRVEVLTALGVAVMIATLFVTLLNAEVRNWLGLP